MRYGHGLLGGLVVSGRSAALIHSVVVPTRNHAASLRSTLASLAKAVHPTEAWEVVVVDNSDDPERVSTRATVSSLGDDHFRYVPMKPLGLMAARHLGVEEARGDIISWIDDDEDVVSTWFCGVLECMECHDAALVTGPFRPVYGGPPPAWLDGLWDSSPLGSHLALLTLSDFGSQDREIPPLYVWGGNLSVPRSIFYQAKGSHPDYMPPPLRDFQGPGECALTTKVGALGLSAWYTPRCEVAHHVPAARMTLEYMRRRAFTVGIEMSFAEYRREHGLEPSPNTDNSHLPSHGSGLRLVARRIGLGKMRRGLRGALDSRRTRRASAHPESPEDVRLLIRQEMLRGYAHHRTALAASHELREWVLRPDFLGENGIPPGADRIP